jgi:hypothetical protein
MKFKENIKLQGILSIWKFYPHDPTFPWAHKKAELAYHGQNLITLSTKQQILSYFYTATFTDPIVGIKIGTGGTIDPAGLFPKTEDQTWTNLNSVITTIGTGGLIAVGQVVDSTIPQVTFLADIDQSTANGSLINEAGLFKTSANMFNVKTFPGIPKTSEFSLHFEWVIKLA